MFTQPSAVIAVVWCSHRHLWLNFDFQLETGIAQKKGFRRSLDVSLSQWRQAQDFNQDLQDQTSIDKTNNQLIILLNYYN